MSPPTLYVIYVTYMVHQMRPSFPNVKRTQKNHPFTLLPLVRLNCFYAMQRIPTPSFSMKKN